MTPAEKIAKAKSRKPKTDITLRRPIVWTCHLRDARQQLGLSLRDVSDAIGLSASAIMDLERGADPQLSNARKLATFFGLSVEQLWKSI